MNIGFMAHDSKKKLIQNYMKIRVKEAINEQQLGAQIENNVIDVMIFFRDPLTPKSTEPDLKNILRLCDSNNIPLATNVATAELLIKSLERGDLEWRDAYR